MRHPQRRHFFVAVIILLIGLSILVGCLKNGQKVLAQDTLKELRDVGERAGLVEKDKTESLSALAGRIINVVLGLVGLFLVVWMIIAGVLWATSGGNPEQIKKARAMIINALIGLAIIVLSYAIASFVVGELVKPSSVYRPKGTVPGEFED